MYRRLHALFRIPIHCWKVVFDSVGMGGNKICGGTTDNDNDEDNDNDKDAAVIVGKIKS